MLTALSAPTVHAKMLMSACSKEQLLFPEVISQQSSLLQSLSNFIPIDSNSFTLNKYYRFGLCFYQSLSYLPFHPTYLSHHLYHAITTASSIFRILFRSTPPFPRNRISN